MNKTFDDLLHRIAQTKSAKQNTYNPNNANMQIDRVLVDEIEEALTRAKAALARKRLKRHVRTKTLLPAPVRSTKRKM